MQPLDGAVDHVRGAPAGRLNVEYGDYDCPYSREAFGETGRAERRLDGELRFSFRHFPLTEIHPHALAAEAAALQDGFWETELGVDVEAFQRERTGSGMLKRVRRDIESGIASGEVRGTPTLFIRGPTACWTH